MGRALVVALAAALLVGWGAAAGDELEAGTEARPTLRSWRAVVEFRAAHPCPATGLARGACPGWVVDHLQPLACGGEDHPRNMQWQTVEEARRKDRWERAVCRGP